MITIQNFNNDTRCFYLIKKRKIAILTFFCIFLMSFSPKNEKIYVKLGKTTTEAFVTPKHLKKIDNSKYYHWYKSRTINRTKGGYSGQLLDGKYEVFNRKKLIEKGHFKNGLKHKIWRKWFENGNIKSISEWKNGLKNGTTYSYDETGKIISEIKYKKGIEIIKPIKVKNDSI